MSDGHQFRLPNTDAGHADLEEIAVGRDALVCFEATGGCEWRLWARLEAAGTEARQLPPAQAEAFGRSRGTLAKTDRIDAELIARFMAFRPEAGRRALRQVLHQAALVASIHNTDLKAFADRLQKEGKPHKVVAAAGRLCVDAPCDTGFFLVQFRASGQALSCVRPVDAAH